MKIIMSDKNITKLSSTIYMYNGSIQSDEELVITVPAKARLEVSGDVRAKGSIIVKGGDLHADGNIVSKGSIVCAGELCSENGSISAVTDIRAGELVAAERDINCIDGDINAPAIRCDSLSCNNYDNLVQSAVLMPGKPNDDNWSEYEKMTRLLRQ